MRGLGNSNAGTTLPIFKINNEGPRGSEEPTRQTTKEQTRCGQ